MSTPSSSRLLGGALLLALFALTAPVAAAGPPVPASPPNYVVDLAGVIDDGVEDRTNALLRELEQQTTAQVVVLTLPTLDGVALEAFSIDLAHNRWKLGQKGKDNGVLLTLAIQERKYRIEVGYGLEGVLPDSLVGNLGREVLVPAFRGGDFGGGITAMARELATRIAAASGVSLSGSSVVADQQSAGNSQPLATGPKRFGSNSITDSQAMGACGALCGSFVFIGIAYFVLNIALLVWVAKDAKNRGMGSSVGWIFLILFTGLIGLIIYLFSRPKGELVICDFCKNKRFKIGKVCPHCGNTSNTEYAGPVKADGRLFCTKCGGLAVRNDAFCPNCGNRIGAS